MLIPPPPPCHRFADTDPLVLPIFSRSLWCGMYGMVYMCGVVSYCRKKVDEDLRDVDRCLEEATRIEHVRLEVEAIKNKLQRYVDWGSLKPNRCRAP